jgi:endonuclease III
VQERIRTIGLYRNKAKNVIALSERLLAEHGGHVPKDREALEALPGVGRKTANVVLNIAFGEETLAVDTHVFRVAHRLDLATGKTPLGSGIRPLAGDPQSLYAACAPLARPAWPLCLSGAQTAL